MMKTRKMISKRGGILIMLITLVAAIAVAQPSKPLTLEECYTLAQQHYPLAKQKELIEKSKSYSIENISKGYLPQFNISGQATYQSDVIKIPFSSPNMNIETPSNDQYKLYGEVIQPLSDLTVIREHKRWQESNAAIQEQTLAVELYKLKDRINQLFFGVLLIDEQLKQTELLKADIQSGLDKANAAVANGVALKSSADVLKAESLRTDQRHIELKAARKAYTDMLGLFINQQLDENTKLEKPLSKATSSTINRPELTLYEYQKKSYDIQNKLLTAKNLPKLSLFFQGGYGRPAFNAFSNKFDFYYIGGARLNWPLTGFYTLKKERQLLGISRDIIDIQREIFLFNTNLVLQQQNGEIIKLQEMIAKDNVIIALRTEIKNTANTQLENGTITSNDYLREVYAEDQAKQNLLLHQVQLLMSQYNYQATSGN